MQVGGGGGISKTFQTFSKVHLSKFGNVGKIGKHACRGLQQIAKESKDG